MRRTTTTLVLLFGLATFGVQAQEEDVFAAPPRATGSGVSAHQPGPMRTWNSTNREEMARDYIRLRAQEKAEARRARIEGMRAIGYSPLRPTVNATPFMSHPPTWSVSHAWVYPPASPIWYHPWNGHPNLVP